MRHLRTSALFAFATFLVAASFLPACGKKSIRSEQLEPTPSVSETVSPIASENIGTPTETPQASEEVVVLAETPEPSPTPTVADYSYVPETVTMEQDPDAVEAALKKKKSKPASIAKGSAKVVTAVKAEPTATPLPAQIASDIAKIDPISTEVTPQAKKSSNKTIWLLLLLLLLGGGWYVWRKRQAEDSSFPTKPSAPLGGLSPVSGFFAKRKKRSGSSSGETKKS
jgi:hypothetical protein